MVKFCPGTTSKDSIDKCMPLEQCMRKGDKGNKSSLKGPNSTFDECFGKFKL